MTAHATVLRGVIEAALQSSAVADAADVALATWAAAPSSGGHVFEAKGGKVGSRNRGRLPFVDYWLEKPPDYDQNSYNGGLSTPIVGIAVHVGGRDVETAQTLAFAIMEAAVNAIRTDPAYDYMRVGDEIMGAFEQGPWGHQLTCRISVEHAATHEDADDSTIEIGVQEDYLFTATNSTGSSIAKGRPVYVSGANIILADADAKATEAMALARQTITDGSSGYCQTEGILSMDDWSAVLDTGATTLVAGTDYFLSTTAGKITATPPSGSADIVQLLGTAMSTTALDLRIEEGVELA